MALHTQPDPLSSALDGMKINKRQTNWLWLFLRPSNQFLSHDDFGSDAARQQMAAIISQNKDADLKIQIKHFLSINLPPDKTFQWIENNERQCAWLESYLTRVHGLDTSFMPRQLREKERIVAMIDQWQYPMAFKEGAMTQAKNAWRQHLQQDRIFDSLNGQHGEIKRAFAWEWLQKKMPMTTSMRTLFSSHLDMLKFFDNPTFNESDKIVCVQSVSRRFSQKRYRDKQEGKKQCNFYFTEEADHRLDALAKRHNLNRTQILEFLIKMEDEINYYLPKRQSL